jgi:hypothetical protein
VTSFWTCELFGAQACHPKHHRYIRTFPQSPLPNQAEPNNEHH